MRFLIDNQSYETMRLRDDHTADCYVRPGKYLHHLYRDGIKYAVARAVVECLKEAEAKQDHEAVYHLLMHKEQLDALAREAQAKDGKLPASGILGDPPPVETPPPAPKPFLPPSPESLEAAGLSRTLIEDLILRTIYNRGTPSGGEIARELRLSYTLIGPLLQQMRQVNLIDIIGQTGIGDATFQFALKSPRGPQAVEEALKKSQYTGPAPVPFTAYLQSIQAQTIKKMVVTRRTIRQAFADLIITDAVLNEIGPAINSTESIFLFGYPGNGKTSIAERITRLMGDDIYIPYAIEAEGAIIKIYDTILHSAVEPDATPSGFGQMTGPLFDQRFIKIRRPVIVTGGELTLPMLDLAYNPIGRFYEAPLQMKANLGIFLIDDFGRQQVRPIDLLNRWIVPLEKRYDFLTTVTGKKLQIPFDQLLIFSTNLDPYQLADEAFLRRIKFKIEVRDPDERQWRQIWDLVCKAKGIPLDPKGLDFMIEQWYKPENRPFRMVHPRDILNQMIAIASYNLESVTFNPDLINAACESYFVRKQERTFGAKVHLE